MTYCVGMLVREGLVMMADTRTNAGIDNVSRYRKLRVFGLGTDRLIMVASAGSLSTTQGAMHRMLEGVHNPETETRDTWESVPSIYQAVLAVGRALRAARDGMESLEQAEIDFDATLLVGGAVGGERHRLFLVYPAGNAIECGADTPYLQVGERKYGKPILDRALRFETPLDEAVKIGLISFDSTMRSNLAVGLPIDLVKVKQGSLVPEANVRIGTEDEYFRDLSERWSNALAHAREEIPNAPY
ncbi:MAG: peptidase [Sphingomicrobium sp.]